MINVKNNIYKNLSFFRYIMNIFLPIYIITILGLKSTLYFAVLLPIAIIAQLIYECNDFLNKKLYRSN